MGAPSAFLHITSGRSAAEHVGIALRKVGREERVVFTNDGINIGPLEDIDEGGASRIAFWEKLEGSALSSENAAELISLEEFTVLRESTLPVVVWHGPFPNERLLALRVCWLRARRRAPIPSERRPTVCLTRGHAAYRDRPCSPGRP